MILGDSEFVSKPCFCWVYRALIASPASLLILIVDEHQNEIERLLRPLRRGRQRQDETETRDNQQSKHDAAISFFCTDVEQDCLSFKSPPKSARRHRIIHCLCWPCELPRSAAAVSRGREITSGIDRRRLSLCLPPALAGGEVDTCERHSRLQPGFPTLL